MSAILLRPHHIDESVIELSEFFPRIVPHFASGEEVWATSGYSVLRRRAHGPWQRIGRGPAAPPQTLPPFPPLPPSDPPLEWTLPPSQTDPLALGAVIAWGCLCSDELGVGPRFCPVHVMEAHLLQLRQCFPEAQDIDALPLFPRPSGSTMATDDVLRVDRKSTV